MDDGNDQTGERCCFRHLTVTEHAHIRTTTCDNTFILLAFTSFHRRLAFFKPISRLSRYLINGCRLSYRIKSSLYCSANIYMA